MRTNRSRRSGFTLIEVLIVVIIMAILAATVIPQFTSSTKDARASSVSFNQAAMRSQIELYKAQHLGIIPVASGLTCASDVNGNPAPTLTVADSAHPYGPYMDQIPANPYNNLNTVTAGAYNGVQPSQNPSVGWFLDSSTGMIWPATTGAVTQ